MHRFEWLHKGHTHAVILVSRVGAAYQGAVKYTHEQAGELPSLILPRNAH